MGGLRVAHTILFSLALAIFFEKNVMCFSYHVWGVCREDLLDAKVCVTKVLLMPFIR